MPNFNKRRQPVLLGAAAAVVATGVAAVVYARRKLHPPLPTVAHVDLHRYAGLWYEIARLPTRYEKDCQHVTAEYRLRPDGRVNVRNTCHRGSLHAAPDVATGTARALDATNARLKVQFFWPFEGDYWILALDEADYQYALVGEPTRRHLWLLARKPHLPRNLRDQLVGQARALGFAVDNLIYPSQPVAGKP